MPSGNRSAASSRDLEREARLAGPARARSGSAAGRRSAAARPRAISRSRPRKRGELGRQVVGHGIRGSAAAGSRPAAPRSRGRRSAPGRERSLSRCSPSSRSVTPVGQRALDQRPGRAPRRAPARRARRSRCAPRDARRGRRSAAAQHPFTGVQPIRTADLRARRPCLGGEALAAPRRPPRSPAERGEDHEERVPLGPDLDAALRGPRGSRDLAMPLEQRRPAVAQLLGQARRALDVGEQEGDGPGRKLGHARQVSSAHASASRIVAACSATLPQR